MKRFIMLICTMLMLAAVILSGVVPVNSAGTAPATNTKRPLPATLPATNTPRATVKPVTQTPTVIPTKTLVPSKTPTFTKSPTLTKTYTLTPSLTPTTIGPIEYPDNINTLTGLPYPNEEARNRRNLIVKVSNYTWIVRPQSGLDKADLVWEYEVEGGVTRFAAIYRSQDAPHVGSVRSARLPDLELMAMYQSLLAYSGANDNITKMIFEGNCIEPENGRRVLCDPNNSNLIQTEKRGYWALTPQRGVNCPPFCRFNRPGLPTEHTLFANTAQVWEVATKWNVNTGIAARGFAFDKNPQSGGKAAKDIFIDWFGDQDARWQYNPTDNKYYRWNTGLPHIDADSGQQLTADNVVIIEAYHVERPDVYESESGSPAIDVQIWGQQKAWVFRDGVRYEGIWIRRNRERGALMLMTSDGKESIKLRPGNTWIEVVRCCAMNGVDVDVPADIEATATYAAMTATAKGPKISGESLSKTAVIAEQTNQASAATAGFNPNNSATPESSEPTATPEVVG
jgi:hypothetical protein